MRLRNFIAFSALIYVAACGESQGSSASIVGGTPNPAPPPVPAPTPGVATVPSSGGTVSLPLVADIQFPSGAFSSSTTVQVSQVAVSSLPQDYTFNTKQFYADQALPNAILVTMAKEEPVGAASVKITLPATYVASKPSTMAFAVVAATVNSGDQEETYDTYDLIDPLFDSSTSQLTFSADASYFTQRDSSNNVVGKFVVVQVPGPQRTK